MALTYTTIEAVGRRLVGRLYFGVEPNVFGAPAIPDELIDQVGAQIEARVNAMLKKIYEFPLQSTVHPELASIVEKLTISELVEPYDLQADQQGTGTQTYAVRMRTQGLAELEAIASGDVQLEGEIPLYAPKSITPNRTVVIQRESTAAQRTAGYDQEANFTKGDAVTPIQADSIRW